MGNENLKDNANEDFVTFELIQDQLGLKNPILFKKYLAEIFIDLSTTEKAKTKIMPRMTFYDYIKLPIFIAEKLFMSFSKQSTEYLTESEFVNGFFQLYMGSFEQTIKIIFNLLDINKDGIINKDDVKIILSYLPINNETNDENNQKEDFALKIFGNQMKSLEEIDNIVNNTFQKYNNEMTLNQFTECIKTRNSEVFLQLLCFFYEQMPFSAKNIESLKLKYNMSNDDEYERLSYSFRKYRNKNNNIIKIKTPKNSTILSPASIFIEQFNKIRKFSLNENYRKDSDTRSSSNNSNQFISDLKSYDNNISGNSSAVDSNSPQFKEEKINNIFTDLNLNKKNSETYKNCDLLRLNNENIYKSEEKNEKKLNLNEILKKSKKGYNSPTKYLEEKSFIDHLAINNNKKISLYSPLNPIKENEENETEELINNLKNEKEVHYENYFFKKTNSQKLRKYYVVLINKDTYYYQSEDKKNYLGMHNLSGCFVQENNETEIIDDIEYYSFEIYFNNKSKSRKYYTQSQKINKEFVDSIKKAVGYLKFSDYYEMKQVIGKGKFGVVNLGIHKKTGKQVAIKIINKENLKTNEDKELVKIEIGILKLCHHPNIVKLLDHLENMDYIYIIMEYIEGGTLGQYFKKKHFNFSERQATNIMYQIANGIKYLHKYGIVHRDLKPDNIMITQQNEYGVIKIMDFGLSKIVSPQEKMTDGYGTLSYVSPEILLRSPYNKEVDIWSMGVILFYMLSGRLPFRGTKEQEVAEKIVYDDLEFDEDDWETRSQKVKDLIVSCLEKKTEDRISIDEFINHPWFKKNMKQKYSV